MRSLFEERASLLGDSSLGIDLGAIALEKPRGKVVDLSKKLQKTAAAKAPIKAASQSVAATIDGLVEVGRKVARLAYTLSVCVAAGSYCGDSVVGGGEGSSQWLFNAADIAIDIYDEVR